MTGGHRHGPKTRRFTFMWFVHLLFPLHDRFLTYQQRRTWRARAVVFFLLGVILTVAVEATLGTKFLPLCPK